MIIIAEVSELSRKIKLPTDRVLSVNGDYQVDGIAFKLPATYDGDFDFSTAAARVHWTGVDKVEHTNLITEVDGNGYPLWTMPSELTQGGHGVIEFAVSFVATDETAAVTKRWISDPVSFRNRRTVNGSNEDEEAEEETTYDRLASAIATVRAAQAEVEDTNAVLSSLTGSAPVPVENRSDMVDDGHLYLYTGDETGLVTGNLYYYVNGTLTNGGQYGSMEVDATLTQSGQAADAKKTGDEISAIKEDLSEKTDFLDTLQYTIGSNITTSYETGYYINESNGTKAAGANFAILTAPVVGGSWYLINPYIKWNQNGHLFAFYDANGNIIKVNNSRPYSSEKYIIVDDNNRLYLILAPENAAILRVNVYATDAASAEIKDAIVTKRIIENLEVAYRNLNGGLKSLIDKAGENDAGRTLAMSVTLSDDITTERKTGYWVGQNGAESPLNNFAIMGAPVTPYTWIRFRTYNSNWGQDSKILAFYDAEGKVINPAIVADESNFITLSLNERVYMAHVPKDAVMFKTTVYADAYSAVGAHLSESTINVVTPSKYVLMGGLVREENLGKELRARLDAYDSAIVLPTDIINKPFDFTGKSLVVFGDSISYGYGVSVAESWTYKFANKFGITRSNLSQSGTTIAGGIYTRITSYTGSPDYIFVAGGTNDYNQGVAVGEYGDEYADGTFYGALDGICQYLQTNCPNSQVFFFTPIPYLNVTSREVAGMDEYRKAIFEVATKYGYNVVRCDNIGFPEKVSAYSAMLYQDKIHPTAIGHDLMYRAISGKIC